jgi:signal transduction histidine kinase
MKILISFGRSDIAKDIREDIIGQKCYKAYHRRDEPCDPCLTLKVLNDGEVHEHDTEVIDKENKIMYFHSTANVALRDKDGNPTAAIKISRDITDSKRLEQQLLQAQKMEAIGQLAGGIAHDFNNILTAIIGYGSLLQMEMTKDAPLSTYVTNILSSAERASNLTQALLAFSRKQIISSKPVNLNEIIRVLEKLLSRLIGEDIELTVDLTDKNLTIMADPTQIEQVLLNLVTNSRDAMPEGGVSSSVLIS